MPAVSSILLAGGLAASLGSGIAGAISNMSAQERAAMLQEKGVQEWLKVNVPDIASQKLNLDEFVRTGKLTPELESVVKPLDSKFEQIRQDPKLKEARMRSLAAMEEQGYGGEQIQDTAARQQALIDSGAKNRGEQEAITGSMARRGQLGSGMELAARQGAAQAEGDRLAKSALDIEKQRRDRAYQSIRGAGDLAGDIQSSDFQRDSAVAQARDAINMFNTKNTQDVSNRNVTRTNAANEYNLDKDQAVADKNVATNNYEQEYNKELLQKKFQNDAAKAAGMSGQYAGQAGTALAQGKSAADMWGGIAAGTGSAALAGSKAAAGKKDPFTSGYDLENPTKTTDDDDLWAGSYA